MSQLLKSSSAKETNTKSSDYHLTLFTLVIPSTQEEIHNKLKKLCGEKNPRTVIHNKKTVFKPKNDKDEMFGSVTTVESLSDDNSEKSPRKKSKYLEVSGRELVYHKHQCLIRSIDQIEVFSGDMDAFLAYLGHFVKFSWVQKGVQYNNVQDLFQVLIYTLSDQKSMEDLSGSKNYQIMEVYCVTKYNLQEYQQKLLNFVSMTFPNLQRACLFLKTIAIGNSFTFSNNHASFWSVNVFLPIIKKSQNKIKFFKIRIKNINQ
ncbi:hypothetical protein RFI_18982 [Reticulomyxa filosa]|uniref:Mediator of RNA polymerase II transcription subunit 18 n=1 Tax=Reticulomyxa filosa TaxID=46433 RepID=X6MWT6_RETFI|nr:hypothetical protein RFI_18982 [Reticulomyxa filosa]|eukprot:ETO18294.1 hypothetical protein RFI_18982 [Reticulomyxa filosa]